MRNQKLRDMGQPDEDAIEAASDSSDDGKSPTSSSTCPFNQSDQSLGSGSASAPKKDEEKENQKKLQQQRDKERAQRGSLKRSLGGADSQEETPTTTATNNNRCTKCNKKLGLTGGFPCRCGGVFCTVHRYSDRHECNFDYREMGASEIRRDNPLVVPNKLRKL